MKILFLCYGNICRSPLAEGIFADLVAKQKRPISCDSAGTANYHIGSLPYEGSRLVAQKYGLTLTHRGRQLQREDIENFDYILAMDRNTLQTAENLAKQVINPTAKIRLFRAFDSEKGNLEVPDPYGRGAKEFEECYQTLLRCCKGFLEYLET